MIFRDDALRGKTILVTGASSGLGRDAAITMSGLGARMILCGRDESRLNEALAAASGEGHRTVVADFGDIEEAHAAIVAITRDTGPLDAVFHAAGIAALRIAKLYSVDHVNTVLGATVNGALAIAKACAKQKVMADGGSIVFMSSVAAVRGRAGMGVYSASKAAIGGLTRSLAAELAGRSVRVNEVIAGAVETPMHEDIVKNLDDAGKDAYRDLHMLGFGQPSDVSNAVTFLVSDASRWITGSSVAVDGGYSAK